MNTDTRKLPPLLSIPEAGEIYYGLSRSSSYEAALKGQIPWIPVQGKKRAVTALIHRQLGLPLDNIAAGVCDEAA